MLDYIWNWLLMGLLALLFNVTPVFAPSTWAMLAYFHIQHDVPLLPAAVIGALGATAGRVILALATRRFGARLIPRERRVDIDRAVDRINQDSRLRFPLLALFAIGPIPKAMLFMAAGIARMPLAPGALVYGVARTAIYGATLAATGQAVSSLSDVVASPLSGPILIGAQFALMAGTILLFRVDLPQMWRRARRGFRWAARKRTPSQASG